MYHPFVSIRFSALFFSLPKSNLDVFVEMILELEKVIRVPKRKTMKPRCVKTAPGFRGLDDRKNRFVSDANNAKE